jgi:signal transduction histidine kinase
MRRLPLVARVQDAALAAVLAAVSMVEIWLPLESAQGEGSRVAVTVTAVLACAALAFRGVAPLPVLLAIVLTWPVVYTLVAIPVLFWGQFAPFLVAVYSVARHGRGREPLYGALAAAALLLFLDLRVSVLSSPEEIVFHWTATTLVWLAGWGLGVFERRARASALLAAEVEVASRTQTITAIAEERARIARELHDIVAHSVSVMVIQAGAAEQVVDDDPAFVRSALGTIRATGSGALAEMRRLVSMLRDRDADGNSAPLAPQPGLEGLPDLVETARRSGAHVELRIEGDIQELPIGVDLAAFRVVQEALTNIRRHSSAAHVWVTVRRSPDQLEVEIVDDGKTSAAAASPSLGHGLLGMRERAELYGGTVEAGPLPEAGFRVRARLPIAEAG